MSAPDKVLDARASMARSIEEIGAAVSRIWRRAYAHRGDLDHPINVHIPRRPDDDDAIVYDAVRELEALRAIAIQAAAYRNNERNGNTVDPGGLDLALAVLVPTFGSGGAR